MSHDNYIYRKNQLLRAFDKSITRAKLSVHSWLG
jgi:hypothetical protein